MWAIRIDQPDEILHHVPFLGVDAKIGETGALDLQNIGPRVVSGLLAGAIEGGVEQTHIHARRLQ